MSTFLQLVQRLHREVGAAGVAPTAVTSQTGEAQRLVDWISNADLQVQNLWHDWKFLRTEFSSSNTTTAGVRTLAAPSDLARWDPETFFIQESGQDAEPAAEVVEYQEVRGEKFDTSVASRDIPYRIIIMPDNTLRFDPVPDAVYTITADYFAKPTVLAADADVSLIPDRFHESVILGQAMIYYANHESAPEIIEQGMKIYEQSLPRLESVQSPSSSFNSRYTSSGSQIQVVAQ